MNTKVVSFFKKVFHVTTLASSYIAVYGGAIPGEKAAKYVAIGSAATSLVLHLVTTFVPAAAE